MKQIFISYKRLDLDIVKPLINEIEQEIGVKCWYDLEGIETSARFTHVICNAINASDVFLFFHSRSHLDIDFEDDWTIKELDYARRKKKRIVLIKLDDSPLGDEFELLFGLKNYVRLTDKYQKEKLFRDLARWFPNNEEMLRADAEKGASLNHRDENHHLRRGVPTLFILVAILSIVTLSGLYLAHHNAKRAALKQIEWYNHTVSHIEDSLREGNSARYKTLLFAKSSMDSVLRFEESHSSLFKKYPILTDSLSHGLDQALHEASRNWVDAAYAKMRIGDLHTAMEFYCISQDLYPVTDSVVIKDFLTVADSLGNMLIYDIAFLIEESGDHHYLNSLAPPYANNMRSIQGELHYKGIMDKDSVVVHIGDIGVKIYDSEGLLIQAEEDSNYTFIDEGGWSAWEGDYDLQVTLDEVKHLRASDGSKAHVGHRHPVYNRNDVLRLKAVQLANWSSFFGPGEYLYEVYYKDRLLYSKSFQLR